MQGGLGMRWKADTQVVLSQKSQSTWAVRSLDADRAGLGSRSSRVAGRKEHNVE